MLRKKGDGVWLCGLLMDNAQKVPFSFMVQPQNNGHKSRQCPSLDLSHWYNYLNRTLRYLVRNIRNYYQASYVALGGKEPVDQCRKHKTFEPP